MNSAHIPAGTLERYLAGALTASEVLSLHDHCDDCDSCRVQLRDLAARRAEAVAHPTEQECVDCAAGRPVEPWVRVHMAECAECGAIVADLRELDVKGLALPQWMLRAAAILLIVGAAGYWYHGRSYSPEELAVLRDSSGPITFSAAVPETELVREAMRSGKLPSGPKLWAEQSDFLRGSGGKSDVQTLAVLSPVALRIESDQPEFRWSGCSGGKYQVQIFDEDLNPLFSSGPLDETRWRARLKLERGKRYLWQVEAKCGGHTLNAPAPPDPAARFEIATDAVAKRIESAGDSHLARAVIYASESMPEAARSEIDELEKLNPHSALVISLRRSIGK